jgi:NAD(P) transhydrogenase subunit alpha
MGLAAWLLVGVSGAVLAQQDAGPVAESGETEPSASDVVEEPSNSRVRSRGTLVASITIFVLAIFVGFEVITKVPPTLHTPLMSGSNAISGITLVGALLAAGAGRMDLAAIVGTLAVILATINVVGGFLVTHRMLAMFRKK